MLYEIRFEKYLNGIDFYNFDPNIITLITNQSDNIVIYNLETNQVQQDIRNSDGFNLVSSVYDEDLIIATTLTGYLNLYGSVGKKFSLLNQISLEHIYKEYIYRKQGMIANTFI